MKILTRKEFQADLAKMWSEAVHAEYKAQIEAAVLAEREAFKQIIRETPLSNWFQADVIEAIDKRGQA